jgi:TolB protein
MPTASRIVLALALAIAAALSASMRQQPPTSADLLLGAALHAERVEGDLDAAIALYEKVLAAPGITRRQAATALLHLAFCYVRLERAEARRTLERVAREYAEEKDLAEQARRELQRLNQTRGKSANVRPKAPRRVLGDAKGLTEGGPSPDGRYFAFIDDATMNLGIVQMTSGTKRLLTQEADAAKASAFPYRSVWSPDGRHLAYVWYTNRAWELRVTDVADGKARVLTPAMDYVPDVVGWSRDARSVAICVANRSRCEIRLIDLAGGAGRTLLIPGSCSNAQMSPDDRFVAFDFTRSDDPANMDISIWSVEGQQALPAVEHPAIDRLLAWSPDSRSIAFSSDRSGTIDLYTLQLDNGRPRGQPTRIAESVGRIYPSGVTTGGSLFYLRDRSSTEVYLTPVDLERGILDVPRPFGRHVIGTNTRPSISPDGRLVAYLSSPPANPSSTPSMVSIQSIDGSTYRAFLLDLRIQEMFGLPWSADGRSLLLWGNNAQGTTGGIYRFDVQSGRTEPFLLGRLKDGPSLGTARLSADHAKIVGWLTAPDAAKIVAGAVGVNEWRELYRHSRPVTLFPESLSPDGRWLAFQESVRVGTSTAKVVSIENSEVRTVLTHAAGEFIGYAAWTPDSRCLLYPVGKFGEQNRPSTTELRLAPIDGRPPVRLATLPLPVKWLDLSRDGRLLAFSSGSTGTVELWVIEGLFSKAK